MERSRLHSPVLYFLICWIIKSRSSCGEACRVARGGFVLLVEITEPGYLRGTYGVKKFAKGRTIDEYSAMMHPFELDVVRPRYMGGASGPVWGSFVMFRDPTLPPGSASIHGLQWDLPAAPA
jgi:hypothetical protein